MKYVRGEGRDPLTGKPRPRGSVGRATLLGGQGLGFEVRDERDAELARRYMEYLAKHAGSRTKPVVNDCCHISLSWAAGEKPTWAEQMKAAEGLMQALGRKDAAALFYAHSDKDFSHVHIVSSRIRPDDRLTYDGWEEALKAQAWSLAYERESGRIPQSRQWMHRRVDAARRLDHAELREALLEKQAWFSNREADRAFAWAGMFGEDRHKARNAFLADGDLVTLRDQVGGPIRGYSTKEVVAEEMTVQREARALAEREGFMVKPESVAAAAAKHGLNKEQVAALEHCTTSRDFSMLVGEAGTGKSRTLAAIRDAYLAAGYKVTGCAYTHKVVGNLRKDGFDAATIAAELQRVEREEGGWRGEVVIVDEAGMLSTAQLREFLSKIREREAKVVLAGDARQLGSVDRGGMFAVLQAEHGAGELREVQRVKDAGQRRAFNLMHGGKGERDFAGALRIFAEQGAIHWSTNRGAAIRDLGAKYMVDVEADAAKRRLMLAGTNEEVKKLNEFARTLHRERGELGEDHTLKTACGEAAFAAGDRISITQNAQNKTARAAGLANGSFGRITNIGIAPGGKHELTVELDGERGKPGPKFQFVVGDNRERGEFNGLKHGYASTVYKSQGDTLDEIYSLHSPSSRANSNYVAMSRHRENVSVFVGKDKTKDFDELVRQMSRGGDKTAASSYAFTELASDQASKEATARVDRSGEKATSRAHKQAEKEGAAKEGNGPLPGVSALGPLGQAMKLDNAMELAEERADIEQGMGKDAAKKGSPLDWVTPGLKFGAKINDLGERIERADDARAAAKDFTAAGNTAKGAEPQGPEHIAPGAPALPDPEAVAHGGRFDQAHKLGKQPGKTAAGLRAAFRQSDNGRDYIEALKQRGFRMARVDGADQMESIQRREQAEAIKGGRKPRVFQQGELVTVNHNGTVYPINAYSTGATRSEIKAKTAGIDHGTLPNLKSAHFMARMEEFERGAAPGSDVQQWRQKVEAARNGKMAKERGAAPGSTGGESRSSSVLGRGMEDISRAMSNIGSRAANFLDGFARSLESFAMDPKARAEREAGDRAPRGPVASAKEVQGSEHAKAVQHGPEQNTAQVQGPMAKPVKDLKAERHAAIARQFVREEAQERDMSGGLEISRRPKGGIDE
jgi:hypothetical protein